MHDGLSQPKTLFHALTKMTDTLILRIRKTHQIQCGINLILEIPAAKIIQAAVKLSDYALQ